MSKRTVTTNKAPKAVGPYSQAIEANGFLFISGQIPINPETGVIEAQDVEGQTHQVVQNIRAILNEENLTLNDVVKTTCLLTSMESFTTMNRVYAEYFGESMPARVTFAVDGLPLGALVEIEAVAVR